MYSPQLARVTALQNASSAKDIDVTFVNSTENRRLAVVSLKAVAEGDEAFGVVLANVVLRADSTGRWRILQISAALESEQNQQLYTRLAGCAKPRRVVVGVSPADLAAPLDGDNRTAQPELWWDNHGPSTMEVVEWQASSGNDSPWSPTNLYLVADAVGHDRTQVKALFADQPLTYRWRVWSLGDGGGLTLSAWRTFHVLPAR